MSKLLTEECTAYRRALFAIIDKLIAPSSTESLGDMIREMGQGDRRDWPAQRLIDMANGAANHALFRERMVHEVAESRGKAVLRKAGELRDKFAGIGSNAMKEARGKCNKENRAHRLGYASAFSVAESSAEELRAELASVLGLNTKADES